MGVTDPRDATYYKCVSELFDKRHHSLTMLMRLIAILACILIKVDLDLHVYLQNTVIPIHEMVFYHMFE